MIRDRIVFRLYSEKTREKPINVGKELKIDKVKQVPQAYEYSQEQLELMSNQSRQRTKHIHTYTQIGVRGDSLPKEAAKEAAFIIKNKAVPQM